MPGTLFHVGATAMCPHAGQVTVVSSNTRVLVSGMPVATLSDQTLVAGCPFIVGTLPKPCVLVQWLVPATRVMVNGQPAILQISSGLCKGADLGVTIVELLAYVGDHLSYRQDAVATEAYLDTARRRVSVRRHARLLDYPMHDGRNARAWVQLQVSTDVGTPEGPAILRKGTAFLSRVESKPPRFAKDSRDDREARQIGVEIFEAVHDVDYLAADHNRLRFYSWGGEGCCLPAGATSATLRGDHARLKTLKKRILIFVEERGAVTGVPGDADPRRRHAVRVIDTFQREDPLGGALGDEDGPTVSLTEITWASEDALPFPLCLSRATEAGGEEEISAALGNIVLVDHGQTIEKEDLGTVPLPTLKRPAETGHGADEAGSTAVPVRYAPRLQTGPLTQAVRVRVRSDTGGEPTTAPFDPSRSAAAAIAPDGTLILPEVTLETSGDRWEAQRDLLSGGPTSPFFVAEVDDDGTATIRFGDDRFGQRPNPGTHFTATYRVGNGTHGNVGIGAIGHIVIDEQKSIAVDQAVTAVSNPLPAIGGLEPETIEDVRQRAPGAFRTQERAVTAADYAAVAELHAGVQRAAATIRWTGSWRTVYLTVDRRGGSAVDAAFEQDLRDHLERYRLAGHDVEIDAPHDVPLRIALHVCVARGASRSDVRQALTDLFSNRQLNDGRRGLFHPDELTFGQPVYLSRLYDATLRTPGVDAVEFTIFERWGVPNSSGLITGALPMERLEIARLDNDPNFPEHGVLELDLEGGR